MRSLSLEYFFTVIFAFISLCFCIIFILPRYSDDIVVEGEVICFFDEVHSSLFNHYVDNLVVVKDFNGDVHKLKNDKLFFTSSVGDYVKVVYSVKRNCFDLIIDKKIVSVDIVSEV